MTLCTVCRKVECGMRWIVGLVVFVQVTSGTGVWGVVIISVVAGSTIIGDTRMCPFKDIILIMDIKGGRAPSGLGGMTGSTLCGYV